MAISEEVKREIMKTKISKYKVTVVENGIDVLRFSNNYDTEKVRKELGIHPKLVSLEQSS